MSVSLRSLSDQEILAHTSSLVARERRLTLDVLLCLNEIEARKLHLELGHGSLFDYCTQALGYSSSAAWRRIQTARCVARFPIIYGMLERNEVNLSTVSQVSRVIDESNSVHLLSLVIGKSQREVEAVLADYRPAVTAADRVRTVVVRVPANHAACANSSDSAPALFQSSARAAADAGACEKDDYCRNGSEPEPQATAPADTLQQRVMLQFSVRPELMGKLERFRTIAWYRLPARASFEQILDFLLDEFMERHDPASKQQRRGRKLKGAASASPATPGKRYIPAPVRDQVFERDGGQCTFPGQNGRRCGSTLALQIDHIVPVALGGVSTPDNLRLLCAKHNRLEAERILGPLAAS